jgi:toxin ParE1/3/4
MKARYTRRAHSDLHQILDYLSTRSPKGAANVLARIEGAVQKLGEQPAMGHATDVGDVRVLFIGRYPYKVFYRFSRNQLEVLHIRHTARRAGEIE